MYKFWGEVFVIIVFLFLCTQSEDEDREERRQRMKAYAKRHRMDPSDFGDEFIRDHDERDRSRFKSRHEHFLNDAMRHDGRHDDGSGRDIHQRHKDLLAHREQVCKYVYIFTYNLPSHVEYRISYCL